MQIDLYTKVTLTIIATALSVIALKQLSPTNAIAQLGVGCGESANPCYITVGYGRSDSLPVEIVNLPLRVEIDNEPIRVTSDN